MTSLEVHPTAKAVAVSKVVTSIVCFMALPFAEFRVLTEGPRAPRIEPRSRDRLVEPRMFQARLVELALWVGGVRFVFDDNFNSAVVRTTLRTAVISNWVSLSKPMRLDQIALVPSLHEVTANRVSPTLR